MMKSIILFALLAFSALNVQANSTTNLDPENPTAELHKQLSKMINSSNIWEGADKTVKLIVTFTINSNDELVILSTSNKEWDNALKSILNYRKLKVSPVLKNKIFHLPISLE